MPVVALLILAFTASFAARPCVVLNANQDASEAVIACKGWAPGFTRVLRAPTVPDWSIVTELDTTVTATVDTARNKK